MLSCHLAYWERLCQYMYLLGSIRKAIQQLFAQFILAVNLHLFFMHHRFFTEPPQLIMIYLMYTVLPQTLLDCISYFLQSMSDLSVLAISCFPLKLMTKSVRFNKWYVYLNLVSFILLLSVCWSTCLADCM